MLKERTAFLILVSAIGALAVFVLLQPVDVAAQCALCRTAVQGGGEKTARAMNLGILVLLVPPVAIFCAIFAVALKTKNDRDDRY